MSSSLIECTKQDHWTMIRMVLSYLINYNYDRPINYNYDRPKTNGECGMF